MTAHITALHHFTVGCAPAELPVLLAFYTRTLGLTDGHRPPLRFPGHWLYADGHAIVHLNALHATAFERGVSAFDHIALSAHGLEATRTALRQAGTPFHESPLSGTRLHQVFLQDPLGLKVELNFDLEAEELQDTSAP